ncbi:MAG TPA: hypothetical protein VGO91_07990 [Pyrinomonadaceae bacterium]|jgi:hypothetical protein|nr:hypothetical protein [Pyrinomonadaceae bacterium]
MKSASRCLLFIFILFTAHQLMPAARAQQRRAARGFQGEWEKFEYPTSRDELPPAFKDEPLKDVPRYSLSLTIKQRGNRLSGDYGGTARYLARLEEGSTFSAIAQGNTARFRVVSGFGGHALVSITLRGDKLYWKIIMQEGELYFPNETVLHRVKKRRRG